MAFSRRPIIFFPFFALILLLAVAIFSAVHGIRCYTGFKVVRGQSFGGGETECKDENEYCYNVTAEAGALISAAKAGCSYYRCLIARNKCINTEFSGIPVSFCCCDTEDLCNGQ